MRGSRTAFVHYTDLVLRAGTDPAAPGGAVTSALCGQWDHEGVCRWPHNNAIDVADTPAVFRTVFIATTADEVEIRRRIDLVLANSDGWFVVRSGARSLATDERELARRLTSARRPS